MSTKIRIELVLMLNSLSENLHRYSAWAHTSRNIFVSISFVSSSRHYTRLFNPLNQKILFL
jgi:hypothetical protein